MRKPKGRLVLGVSLLVLIAGPVAFWVALTHSPRFYRKIAAVPPDRRRAEARRFVAQSLQLRNDIANEERWDASFSDEEVNAWLAEDLVTHFADQIPAGVHEPRIAFEADRVVLAFGLDRGPIRSVVWVVARVEVPEENTLALTLEKIRAGVVPVPPGEIIERIDKQARKYGLDIEWDLSGDSPVAKVRYLADPERDDIVLERLQITEGRADLAGRSNRSAGRIASPILPNRRTLQSTFPRRNTHAGLDDPPSSLRRVSSTTPTT